MPRGRRSRVSRGRGCTVSPEEIALKAARIAADLLLTLLPHEDAKRVLDEQSVKLTNALADAAEDVKFGG